MTELENLLGAFSFIALIVSFTVILIALLIFTVAREKIRATVEVSRAAAPPPLATVVYVTHRTERLLRELHKWEYDELAAGSHDAFRDVREAQAPAEDESHEADRCVRLVRAINFIRSQSGDGSNLIGFPPDLDRMLERAIQKHEDEYNHPDQL